jgi:DNA-binding transcriptional ArsR family regulator
MRGRSSHTQTQARSPNKSLSTHYTHPAQSNYLCDATNTPHAGSLTGTRSPTAGLPDDVGLILIALGHPNRLPILLALEEHPRTFQELVEALNLKPHPARHAITQLRTAGLVHIVDQRPTAHNLVGFVYGTPFSGWADVLSTIIAVANSRPT